jgi:hypothetical protein
MRRLGRSRQYSLCDEHIDALIDSALDHVRAGERSRREETDSGVPSR